MDNGAMRDILSKYKGKIRQVLVNDISNVVNNWDEALQNAPVVNDTNPDLKQIDRDFRQMWNVKAWPEDRFPPEKLPYNAQMDATEFCNLNKLYKELYHCIDSKESDFGNYIKQELDDVFIKLCNIKSWKTTDNWVTFFQANIKKEIQQKSTTDVSNFLGKFGVNTEGDKSINDIARILAQEGFTTDSFIKGLSNLGFKGGSQNISFNNFTNNLGLNPYLKKADLGDLPNKIDQNFNQGGNIYKVAEKNAKNIQLNLNQNSEKQILSYSEFLTKYGYEKLLNDPEIKEIVDEIEVVKEVKPDLLKKAKLNNSMTNMELHEELCSLFMTCRDAKRTNIENESKQLNIDNKSLAESIVISQGERPITPRTKLLKDNADINGFPEDAIDTILNGEEVGGKLGISQINSRIKDLKESGKLSHEELKNYQNILKTKRDGAKDIQNQK